MTNISLDPSTLQMLRRVLDKAAQENPAQNRFDLAGRILECAVTGERDPARLQAAAVRTRE